MRIQPDYCTTTKQSRFSRFAGQKNRHLVYRWIMRSSNGSEWVTEGHYTLGEARLFVCAEPLQIYEEN